MACVCLGAAGVALASAGQTVPQSVNVSTHAADMAYALCLDAAIANQDGLVQTAVLQQGVA